LDDPNQEIATVAWEIEPINEMHVLSQSGSQ
jgi:hypothetical protein